MAPTVPQWEDQSTIEVDRAPEGREPVTGAFAVSQALELVPGTAVALAVPELVPGTAGSPASASRRAIVEPLSPGRYKVQFTASAELHDQLERLAALMRSEVPDGDIAAIIQRAVAEKLATARGEALRQDSRSSQGHSPQGGLARRQLRAFAPHPGSRAACRARARRRPLPLRRRAGPTLLRAAQARVPSPTPLRHGRRSQPREHQPAVPSPQPLRRRARLWESRDQQAPDLARGNIQGSREPMTAGPWPVATNGGPPRQWISAPLPSPQGRSATAASSSGSRPARRSAIVGSTGKSGAIHSGSEPATISK